MKYPVIFTLVLLQMLSSSWTPNVHAFMAQPAPSRMNSDLVLTMKHSIQLLAATAASEASSPHERSLGDTSATSVEFPPPLTTVDRLKRAATFWSTALPIVASYYGLISRIRLQEILSQDKLTEHEIEALWDAQHAKGAAKLAETITRLKGFYVKTAQIISTRQDLFPEQYSEALSIFTDNVDPMPLSLAKAVVQAELLHRDEAFDDVFAEFDERPLGAASVAQVHRAVLTEKYGRKQVAVKIQRPSIESKLMGDIANLIALSKTFRNNPALPLDYYTVFTELEKQLKDEFDFVHEAVAMDRIYNALAISPDGSPRDVPLVIPRPVRGLVSRRVLVMDYLEGVPLSRAREEMLLQGIDPDSPQSKLFGRKLLTALTDSFGRTILETGFFHADPHPGNIFVMKDGRIGLIDFGQVKQISGRNRETLCKVMIALDERRDDEPTDLALVGKLAMELGVELQENAPPEAAPAVGIWLFDGSVEKLPGGYDKGELSPNSPVRALKSFPQDLVLVGRSSILIKGISNRLGIPWSLAREWAPIAREVLGVYQKQSQKSSESGSDDSNRVRLRDVARTLRQWLKGRASKTFRRLPTSMQTRIASFILRLEERKARNRLTSRAKTSTD